MAYRLAAPGTIDGGDVLRIGRRIFVGQSGRSNESGIEQLRAVVWPYGYTVTTVPVGGCLHLKSAITQVGPDTVLVNPAWVDAGVFGAARVIERIDEERLRSECGNNMRLVRAQQREQRGAIALPAPSLRGCEDGHLDRTRVSVHMDDRRGDDARFVHQNEARGVLIMASQLQHGGVQVGK